MQSKTSNSVVYRVCYTILHTIYTIYEIQHTFFKHLKFKIIELCHEFSRVNKRNNYIKPEKVPRHLTVLLGQEEPSVKDLANIVLWCLATNITYLSFYDYKGRLEKCEDKLRLAVERNKSTANHVKWCNDATHKNVLSGQKVHVKVVTAGDGRLGVITMVKKYASNSISNFTIDDFDGSLREKFQFPDPDVGLCFGKTFCLYGYPPWQIRVTEFFHLATHHGFTFEEFIKLLFCYNKCEQRYGK